jgi:hypothetical protein
VDLMLSQHLLSQHLEGGCSATWLVVGTLMVSPADGRQVMVVMLAVCDAAQL